MAYDRALISRILRQMEQQRQQHEAEAEERRYRLTHTIPRLGEIDRELRATSASHALEMAIFASISART